MTSTVVIGGGIGGMVAALRARLYGNEVTLIEARAELGGLASPLLIDGEPHDGGPYILLDRVRLGWALNEVGLDLEDAALVEMDPAHRIDGDPSLTIYSDLERTIESVEAASAGSGPPTVASSARPRKRSIGSPRCSSPPTTSATPSVPEPGAQRPGRCRRSIESCGSTS